MKCEICGREHNVKTVSSSIGEFYHNVCDECMEKREKKYSQYVYEGLLFEDYVPEFSNEILALCHINGKDEVDFNADVWAFNIEFMAWCAKRIDENKCKEV